MPLHVTQLWIYPVKSCRGIALATAELDAWGLRHDRRFLIVDASGKGITQRSHPPLARIETALEGDALVLRCEGHDAIRVLLSVPTAETTSVELWGHRNLHAEDCGNDVASWLREVLQVPVRLVRAGRGFRRPVKGSGVDSIAFPDAYPLLVLTEASLAHLNERLIRHAQAPVPMDRFRPNLVVGGAEPHAEDVWRLLEIDAVRLRAATACVRCVMVTTDQLTGQRNPEPLRTLATYRRDPQNPRDICFGRNLVNESKSGQISVGQPVAVS